jgi:hypothetical protein
MRGTTKAILEIVEHALEGRVFTAKEHLHLGNRAAVDQALTRLERQGHLLRIARGRYVKPVETRFGPRTPAPEQVVESFAGTTAEVVAPSGATAANELGLTTQVPVRSVYLTSGKSRRLELGRQRIELKHAPPWQLQLPRNRAGQAVRALAWLGRGRAKEAATTLKSRLTPAEQKEVLETRRNLPTWLAQTVSDAFASAPQTLSRARGG